MFYSRKIILVEGISEQLIIPCLHKLHFDKTIEANSTCIINVNGLAFKNFLEIIRNGYFQKCLVLTDSDTGTATENRADNLIIEYNDIDEINIQKTILSTFEKDIIEANSIGSGAACLKLVVQSVRPKVGKKYIESLKPDEAIDVEVYFKLIEGHKSAFAFELMTTINSGKHQSFKIPIYIEDGFNYLAKTKVIIDA
jgi:predicted ATP-dependent endonuclease of OLD family